MSESPLDCSAKEVPSVFVLGVVLVSLMTPPGFVALRNMWSARSSAGAFVPAAPSLAEEKTKPAGEESERWSLDHESGSTVRWEEMLEADGIRVTVGPCWPGQGDEIILRRFFPGGTNRGRALLFEARSKNKQSIRVALGSTRDPFASTMVVDTSWKEFVLTGEGTSDRYQREVYFLLEAKAGTTEFRNVRWRSTEAETQATRE